MRKQTIMAALLCAASAPAAWAQSGTNSPYSQFGLGTLADQTSGFNRGMNGVGLAFREHNQVNYINPASYSAIDSLSFIWDVGASLQLTHFEEGGVKKNARNGNLEYVVAGLRLAKGFGLSFGLVPLTNVGYSYSSTNYVGNSSGTTTHTLTNSGSGGFHQVYVGLGWSPWFHRRFSLGANFSYVWGNYSRSVAETYSDSYINSVSRVYSAHVQSWRLDLGAQYVIPLGKKNDVTLAFTYTPGHSLGGDPQMISTSTNSTEGTSSADTLGTGLKLHLPDMYGFGISWNQGTRWHVGVDYSLQKWGKLEQPAYIGERQYVMTSGLYMDRKKINIGGEYVPNAMSRNFINRIHYRLGASYSTPYYKMNTTSGLIDGPKEYSLSGGFGIPLSNAYSNRSFLNISAQWVRSTTSLIKENTFRINLGLTFDERWFMKFKVE